MSTQFQLRFLKTGEPLPPTDRISAVFLVAFQGTHVLSVRNERGWDVPGGHLDGDEDCLTALKREVLEEAGAELEDAQPYAILSSTTSSKVMAFFMTKDVSLVEFVPSEDALERGLLNPDDLLSVYYGDKELLGSLIREAGVRLKL